MKITVSKIIKELEKKYGWADLSTKSEPHAWFVKELIKDTLKIVDEELRTHKGVSITNSKP